MNSMSEKSQPDAYLPVPDRSGHRALPLPSQLLARLAFWAAILAMLCGFPAGIFAADPVTKSFTDSQGRTTLYRYSLKDDWNPRQPRGVLIFFHGNQIGTQLDMLFGFPWFQGIAYQHDLVPVVVASPETYLFDGIIRRIWTDEDGQLFHELLQSQFGGDFSVDFGRIVFWGGSAGSAFLHGFVRSYGENYGGGLLAWCGHGIADPFWRPTQQFRERFRVLVKATTEDFTHGKQTGNYGYYKYILGLETRGDLQAPGGHCWGGEYSWATAVGWLLEGTGIPEEPVEPHFERAAVFDYITGLTVDGAGALWVVRQTPAQKDAAIWRSVDRGTSWEAVSRVPLIVADIDAVGDALFLTASTPDSYRKQLYRSLDGGLNFTIAGGTDNPRLYYNEPLLTDRDGKLYVMGSYTKADSPDVYVSDDLGESWTSLGLSQEAQYIHITNPDGIWTEQSGLIVVSNRPGNPWWSSLSNPGRSSLSSAVGKTEGNDWRVLADTPSGLPYSIVWDGSSIWGVAGSYPYSVFQSFNLGSSWLETELPSDPAFSSEAIQRLSALNGNQQLLFGEGANVFLRDGGGVWRLLHGGATLGRWLGGWSPWGTIGESWDARITLDPSSGDVFASDGRGIFRLDAENRTLSNVGAAPDIDHDGVPDARDAFPSNPAEYLDTDGDGIGNHADSDSDGDGVADIEDGAPFDRYEVMDTDGDGVGDGADLDDDGDGVLDVFDDFPLDEQENADTDGDQIGDRSDADDDGDGVNDLADAFPRYPREWLDTDGDGIGDNLDSDDDNDGLADHADPDPLDGPEKPGFLRPADHLLQLFYVFGSRDDRMILPVHQERPSQIIYPDDLGDAPSFGYIRLGDQSSFEIQFAIDEYAWRDNSLAKVYFDRNGNGDLTDDGPPSFISSAAVNWPGIRIWPLEIPYASGEVVPYGISIDGARLGHGGSTTAGSQISSVPVNYGGSWVGEVAAPNGSMILVQTVDYDIDGVFNRSPEDFVCIDVDGDRGLDCGPDGAERFRHEEPFTLDGQQLRALVAASGHRVELVLAESPGATPPSPPTRLTATAVSFYQVNLSWRDNSDDEEGFRVQRRVEGSSDWIDIGATAAAATTYSDTGLEPTTTYRYRVRAYRNIVTSAFSNEAVATTPKVLPPTLARFTPTRGPVGSQVTLVGTDFHGATAVVFNGVGAARFEVVSGTRIEAVVPLQATSGPIRVVAPGGIAESADHFTVIDSGIHSRLFVPIVLRARGRTAGSFFTSELTLTNRGTTTAAVHYTYTASIGKGSGTVVDSLEPSRQRVIPDAIAYLTSLGVPIRSGSAGGALMVDFSNLSSPSDAAVTVRVSTPVEEGRAGLAYMGLTPDGLITGPAFITGLRQNRQDRSNVAVQNAGISGEERITLRVTVISGDPEAPGSLVLPDLSLPPRGFHQYNGILNVAGFDNGYVKVERVEGASPYYAYGVINDNFNSDGSFVFPVREDSLAGKRGQTLPVIIETGAFTSELTVTNFSPVTKTVDFRFVAEAVETDDDTASFSLTLEAREQRILPQVVDWLRQQEVAGIGLADEPFVGAVFATVAEGDMRGIVMGARTGAPDERGGQYGLFYNGVPYGSASVESAWIYALQQNEENRSNLAVVNTGEIDDSSSTFEITIYDGSGDTQPRTKSVTLSPRRWSQINGILGGTSQGYVEVRKTIGHNPFLAYGVVNDGGAPGERSGDGAYVPARD